MTKLNMLKQYPDAHFINYDKVTIHHTIIYLFIYLFIYTVLIERAIHNSMCSNALIHTYKGIHNYTCI